jgi:DNA-binding NtrC family response regulator
VKHIPQKRTPILIVDDDTSHLLSIKAILKDSDIPEPALVSDSRQVLSLLREHHFPFVLLDLMMPHISGMELLQQIKTQFPDTECVILTGNDDTASAVKAMKFGAYDYIIKPFSRDKIIILIHRALELYYLKHGLSLFESEQTFKDLKNPHAFKGIVATDDSMARIFHQVEAVAATDYSVIISGASGTGKEMLARAIHRSSLRYEQPFLAVNMGAFSSSLFEREFFGHEKGAYTGASDKKQGFFEAAHGGTLFMDEITDLELSRQGVLLRTLQEREIYPLGSTEPQKVDVRILAATNRDIAQEVKNGNFRADLYHRLNMYHIKIPLLKDRKKDILPLANHFLNDYARQNQKKIGSLSQSFERHLINYSFPGNIRELENIIASAVLSEQSDVLTLSSLGEQSPLLNQTALDQFDDLPPLEDIEKRYISKVLSATEENRTQAAKILGIGLRTLQRKLKKYGSMPL